VGTSARVAAAILSLGLAVSAARAVEEAPPTPERGRALLDAKEFERAERVFEALVAKDPGDGRSWFLLGYARHSRREWRGALEAHRRAAAFAPFAAGARYNAACALARLEEPDAALEEFRAAVAAGFRDRGLLAEDEDLAPLRRDPRLAAILRPLIRGAGAFVEPVRVIHEIEGETAGEEFGWVARAVGDLDADGVVDFAATAPGRGGGAGRVSAWSSRTGRMLFSADGKRGDRLGNSVAPAGDVDGDGVGDVVVGAPGGTDRPGYALVLSGKSGALLLRLDGEAAGDQFGLGVCGAGDLDGDGRAEIAVSAWRSDGPGGAAPDAGAVTVHAGRGGGVLLRLRGERAGDLFGSGLDSAPSSEGRLLAVGAMDAGPGRRGRVSVFRIDAKAATPAFSFEPAESGADLGQYFVAFAGDFDGDGVPDVLASDFADRAGGANTGRVLVRSGRDGRGLLDLPGRRPGEGFGTSRGVCGDVDGDGRADAIVGAWQNGDGAPSGGRCYLVGGKDGGVLATWTSRMDQDTLGFDAVGLGDVDGDGGTDFLLTAAWSEVHGPRTGRLWVVAGPAPRK